MEHFTTEEINLICIYNTATKAALLADMKASLPYIEDAELKEIQQSVMQKAERLTDEEFAAISFEPDYTEEGEDDIYQRQESI